MLLCFKFSLAQENLRNEWFIGIANYKLKFNDDTTKVSFLNELDTSSYIFKGNSNICDAHGQFLIATDGIKLYNSKGEIIHPGGENINNDSIYNLFYGNENSVDNTSIIIPMNTDSYYIFTTTMSNNRCDKYFNHWNNDTFGFDEVRYSIVDFKNNTEDGQITIHNKLLLHADDYPYVNMTNFTACRHANGRDWWLLKPSARMRQVMYKFLVRPDTIITFQENLPLQFNDWAYDVVGQSCFSKDGSLYAECNNNGPHTIYHFDRCSGELSLYRLLDLYPYKDTFGMGLDNGNKWRGVCFSPNNRFLYTCDAFNVYQVDLQNMVDSEAVRRVSKDTNINPQPLGFPQYSCMQLTPTGQIYLGNWHGISSDINAIMYPDKLGDSCGFKFSYSRIRVFTTLSYNNTNGPPNNPFYGLGPLKGSPCDTIGKLSSNDAVIYPNPTTNSLHIYLPKPMNSLVTLMAYNILGQRVGSWKEMLNSKQEVQLTLPNLAAGVYTLKMQCEGQAYNGKFVVE